MKLQTMLPRLGAGLICAAIVCGCDRPASSPPAREAERPAAPSNRVDTPQAVRQNLGITFARVESRAVAATRRFPGRFELLPEARREYRANANGRLELAVSQYQRVKTGDVLYTLDSADWRAVQHDLAEALIQAGSAESLLASTRSIHEAHAEHRRILEERAKLLKDRIATLESLLADGGSTRRDLGEAKISLNESEKDLAEVNEKDAEIAIQENDARHTLAAARIRQDLLLQTGSLLHGVPVEALLAESNGTPRWRQLDRVSIHAAAGGVVESLNATQGGAVASGDLICTIADPERVRFRAGLLQGDASWASGTRAQIRPTWNAHDEQPIECEVSLAPIANADDRTIDVLAVLKTTPAWARPGLGAELEVVVAGEDAHMELAVPVGCIVRDGLTPIMFRRDPKNPDVVIRMTADLGASDGRWVAVASGVRVGDEVVLDGVYQLHLATSGAAPKGGHFHADGTFHAGEDE